MYCTSCTAFGILLISVDNGVAASMRSKYILLRNQLLVIKPCQPRATETDEPEAFQKPAPAGPATDWSGRPNRYQSWWRGGAAPASRENSLAEFCLGKIPPSLIPPHRLPQYLKRKRWLANQPMDQPLAIPDTTKVAVFCPCSMYLSSAIYIPQPHGRNEPR